MVEKTRIKRTFFLLYELLHIIFTLLLFVYVFGQKENWLGNFVLSFKINGIHKASSKNRIKQESIH